MDPSLAAQPSSFEQQFQMVMYYLGPIAQVAYWLGMLLFVGYAVWQFKRWVNFQLGTGRSGRLQVEQADADEMPEEQSVSVEEFVE